MDIPTFTADMRTHLTHRVHVRIMTERLRQHVIVYVLVHTKQCRDIGYNLGRDGDLNLDTRLKADGSLGVGIRC